MGGLYAFADSLLNAGQEEANVPSSSLFAKVSSHSSSNDNRARPSLLEHTTAATPEKGFPYFDPESASASSPSVSAPTLFLLDDCLKKMDGVRNRAKELRDERKWKKGAPAREAAERFQKPRAAFLSNHDPGKAPAGRAAEAAKAIKRAQELAAEAKAMEEARKMRRATFAKDNASPNKTKEAIENYRKDKELMEEAVRRKLQRDKEEAERAKNEPPPEFIARQAKKAEDEARKAAFGKGKTAREAMALGKAAYQNVKEKYRKQGLTTEELLEEEKLEEELNIEKRKEVEQAAKVPVLATDVQSAARLGVKDREGDFTATATWKSFQDEVTKWERTGGRNEPPEIRDAFAGFLTDKYMCQKLDSLPKTIVVTKIRKDMMRIIETFVAPSENDKVAAGEEGGVPRFDDAEGNDHADPGGSDTSSEDEDDFDYVKSREKNIKLKLLMTRKKAKEKERLKEENWKGYSLEDDLRRQHEIAKKQLTQIEAKQAQLKAAEDEKERFNFEAKKQRRLEKQSNQKTKKTFKSFEPWKCGVCEKENEAKCVKCGICGRDKTHTLVKAKEAAAQKAAEHVPKSEAEARAWKEEAEKHKKVNDDYLRFIAMKHKTDETAQERTEIAGEIGDLLASLRGTLGPLSDQVVAPPKVTNKDWRVGEPNGRKDGKHVSEVNHDTSIPVDVQRKNEREDWLRQVGAGSEFAPREGPNRTYGMTEAEVNYQEKKRPFDYDIN